jgi:hypothetical protein
MLLAAVKHVFTAGFKFYTITTATIKQDEQRTDVNGGFVPALILKLIKIGHLHFDHFVTYFDDKFKKHEPQNGLSV